MNCAVEIMWNEKYLCAEYDRELSKIQQSITTNRTNEKNKKKKRMKAPPIKNKGWINTSKNEVMLQIFLVNPNRIGPNAFEKNAMKEMKIDAYLISSLDWKWNLINKRIIKDFLGVNITKEKDGRIHISQTHLII